jgi:hypothetical protein
MAVTLQDLLTDPSLFFYEFDQDHAIFQSMTREDFFRSIFLDGRIRHGGRPSMRVPLNALLPAHGEAGVPAPRIGWIFHVAQCGSTLLARALDHIGRSLVLREPAALRRLGVMAGGDGENDGVVASERIAAMLRMTVAMLGKRWEADVPVIVKANVPVNFIARDVMALNPESPAIALYFPLESYVAAILRTERHVRWTEGVFDEMRLSDSPFVAGDLPHSAATKAAALWFAQMKAYEVILADFPTVRSLEAGTFFAEPAETVAAAAKLFGVRLDSGEPEKIAASELFHSYSKNPALDYDPEVRQAREAEARQRLAEPIAEAAAWAWKARERHGLPETLDKPLVGNPPPLLP